MTLIKATNTTNSVKKGNVRRGGYKDDDFENYSI